MALVDVLISTCVRKTGLAVVPASLFNQTCADFDIIISGQSEESEGYFDSDEIAPSSAPFAGAGTR